jgi:hypothetical protein
MDIAIAEDGFVMIVSDRPFADEITRVDFHADSRRLMLNYKSLRDDGDALNIAIDESMLPALAAAPAIMLVEAKTRRGFHVPLIHAA